MLAIYSGVAFTVSGVTPSVAANATVEVRREDTNGLASIYSDEAGTTPITNPSAFADANGRFVFYALGLERGYKITVTKDASTHILRNQAVGKAAQFDLPSLGTDGWMLQRQSGAADGLQYLPPQAGYTLLNGYVDWSVAGNVLTAAIKTWAGTDPSATDPVYVAFRSATPATGALTLRKLIAATSIAINNTALLGTANGVAFRLWCVAFDDGGTVRLALINCLSTAAGAGSGRDVTGIYPLAGWGIASATQEGDASDSAQVFYSNGAAVTDKAYATLGYATWEAGLATAGTWSAGPTRKQLFGQGVALPGQVVQTQRAATGAVATGTTVTPHDDTIPQITEGDQYMTQAITPSSAANALAISAQVDVSNSTGGDMIAALHQDAVANALAAADQYQGTGTGRTIVPLNHRMLSAVSAATTFRVRAGCGAAGTTTFNGFSGGRHFGGVANSFLEVSEVMG